MPGGQRGYMPKSPGHDMNGGGIHHGLHGNDHGAHASFDQSETFTYGDESTIVTNEGDRSFLGENPHYFANATDPNITLPYDETLEQGYDDGGRPVGHQHHFHRAQDATQRVKDVHYALLYLMSNPEEFKEVVERRPYGSSSIAEWQEEASQDDEDDDDENDDRTQQSDFADDKTETSGNQSSRGGRKHQYRRRENLSSAKKPPRSDPTMNYIARTISHDMEGRSVAGTANNETPLPYLIFAPDAEVVLPQAHTASQLFGIEQVDGMELEAAAGIVPLCQLFLRWLALMPDGDHNNIIDPPGLTVMRIAGGRYRVTAAHRVVWTWMNHFDPDMMNPSLDENDEHSEKENRPIGSPSHGNKAQSSSSSKIQTGDLVTMTIVDVFETDSDGRLLSYCPTFDNRSVTKTNPAVEKVIKESTRVKQTVSTMRRTDTAKAVEQTASRFFSIAGKAAINVGGMMKRNIGEQLTPKNESASATIIPPAAGMLVDGNASKEPEQIFV